MNWLLNIRKHIALAHFNPNDLWERLKHGATRNRKLLLGIFLGLIISGIWTKGNKPTIHHHETAVSHVWTCSMHPQIQLPSPDPCPLCGMALIPTGSMSKSSTQSFKMDDSAIKLANIQVSEVEKRAVKKNITLQGKLAIDERRQFLFTAPYPGQIIDLRINQTGAYISSSQTIAILHSPELQATQEAYFDAGSIRESNPSQFIEMRSRLRRWQFSEEHIEDMEIGKTAQELWELYAPESGFVKEKFVQEGIYVKEGTPLFEVVDLSRLWGVFEVYEKDIQWINLHDEIHFKVAAFPEEDFSGKISYIQPWVNPQTRTVSIRIEINNSDLRLKPDMFTEGHLEASPKETVAMHIPKTAVLWTGKQSLVYVKNPHPIETHFELREVELGADLEHEYVILKGLKEGEEVVTHGIFKVDAAAQLAGKASMMTPPNANKLEEKPHIPPVFKHSLTQLFNTYTQLKNALVAGDQTAAHQSSQALLVQLDSIHTNGLPPKAVSLWKDDAQVLQKLFQELGLKQTINSQREILEPLSQAMLTTIRHFGVNTTLYKAYCPMAFDNQGAFWLSEFEEIRNPYFGDAMLKCGFVQEVIWEE